jgi:hypothetical protein
VQELVGEAIADLQRRAHVHDQSKLVSPEVETFDEYTPKLRDSTYGSDEHKTFLAGMGEGLAHHYRENRHHPEHWVDRDVYFLGAVEHPYQAMNLLDVLEMLADWKAATTRHADGDLGRSIEINAERFGMSPEFVTLLGRTAHDLGWLH